MCFCLKGDRKYFVSPLSDVSNCVCVFYTFKTLDKRPLLCCYQNQATRNALYKVNLGPQVWFILKSPLFEQLKSVHGAN